MSISVSRLNEGLSLRVSRQCKGGYRVIGRLGRTFQEIYVNTELNKFHALI